MAKRAGCRVALRFKKRSKPNLKMKRTLHVCERYPVLTPKKGYF
jgi:hypothetical protein